ncbi:hypothetical protein CC77DRAFT_9953 [Alternaria alternata]|uniref:Uncharacterized protein n=1 Tax=Alternaria alternata TaxID=5599 RepID=A0A177E4G7_ALTAL|nr:hypothetical protein CC77DRAFT_9953 [Alternaria alternata]OAG25879.1 hypothetical protein CC77DRAFT_9953 [Alternaria alternata]
MLLTRGYDVSCCSQTCVYFETTKSSLFISPLVPLPLLNLILTISLLPRLLTAFLSLYGTLPTFTCIRPRLRKCNTPFAYCDVVWAHLCCFETYHVVQKPRRQKHAWTNECPSNRLNSMSVTHC